MIWRHCQKFIHSLNPKICYKNLVLDLGNTFYLISLSILITCLLKNVWILQREVKCNSFLGHSLALLWFADLMNVTEEVTIFLSFIDGWHVKFAFMRALKSWTTKISGILFMGSISAFTILHTSLVHRLRGRKQKWENYQPWR